MFRVFQVLVCGAWAVAMCICTSLMVEEDVISVLDDNSKMGDHLEIIHFAFFQFGCD